MRLTLLCLLLASPLAGQTPDSVKTFKVSRTILADSVVEYRHRVDTVRVPVDTTKPPPPPPPPPPTDSCVRKVPVSTSAALINAASYANAGDCILVAAGTYSMTTQRWTRPGTAGKPITLEGVGSATILNLGGNGGIYLQASYWKIRKLRTTNGFFGWQTEGATGVIFDSVEVDNMQQAAINLRYGTNHSTVKNSRFHDTGKTTARYGEAIYVGGNTSPTNTAADQLADNNAILNNVCGPNVRAECVEDALGADSLTVSGNTIDGTGTVSEYGAMNSLMALQGYGNAVNDNVLSKGAPYGIDVYQGSTTFHRNRITDVGAGAVGIRRVGGTAKVYCDNQSSSNVACTP